MGGGGWFNPDSAWPFSSHLGGATGDGCISTTVAPQTSITPTMFLAFFANDPNMNAQDSAFIQMQIDASSDIFNVCRWGSKYNLGQYYYVAHTIMLQKLMGLNPLTDVSTSKRAGGVSKGQSSELLMLLMNDPLMRTLYGQEYLRLLGLLGGGGFAV
jgi:hypothetical protein